MATGSSDSVFLQFKGALRGIFKKVCHVFSLNTLNNHADFDSAHCGDRKRDVLLLYLQTGGAQWLSGRLLDLRPRGRGFEPHRRHCVVSLSKLR